MLCVRWYLTFKLSSRDLVQMMAERGITLTHTTILRWVQRYVPEFEKRWSRYARPVGDSWRVDETYIKVKGQWVYPSNAFSSEIADDSRSSGTLGIMSDTISERGTHSGSNRVTVTIVPTDDTLKIGNDDGSTNTKSPFEGAFEIDQ